MIKLGIVVSGCSRDSRCKGTLHRKNGLENARRGQLAAVWRKGIHGVV